MRPGLREEMERNLRKLAELRKSGKLKMLEKTGLLQFFELYSFFLNHLTKSGTLELSGKDAEKLSKLLKKVFPESEPEEALRKFLRLIGYDFEPFGSALLRKSWWREELYAIVSPNWFVDVFEVGYADLVVSLAISRAYFGASEESIFRILKEEWGHGIRNQFSRPNEELLRKLAKAIKEFGEFLSRNFPELKTYAGIDKYDDFLQFPKEEAMARARRLRGNMEWEATLYLGKLWPPTNLLIFMDERAGMFVIPLYAGAKSRVYFDKVMKGRIRVLIGARVLLPLIHLYESAKSAIIEERMKSFGESKEEASKIACLIILSSFLSDLSSMTIEGFAFLDSDVYLLKHLASKALGKELSEEEFKAFLSNLCDVLGIPEVKIKEIEGTRYSIFYQIKPKNAP